jgi:hypothetical protein
MIVFTNPGVIDVRSVTTFGVSVKEGENPIGFFGTGLKYAIAVLLRTGHGITILAGDDTFVFGVRPEIVRGKQFDFVTMAVNGGEAQPIGFTTELGKQWKVWMAYREIACNCSDERGSMSETDQFAHDSAGTTVVVDGPEFAEIYRRRGEYILADAPDYTLGEIEVRRRAGSAFYYRGVLVHHWQAPAMFTYNCRSSLTLTEDRTLNGEYSARAYIAEALLKSDDDRLLRDVLTAPKNSFESHLDYAGWSWSSDASPAFLRVVGECIAQGEVTTLNLTALKLWRDLTRNQVRPREVTLTAVQAKSLERALDFCSRIGFHVRGAYPIRIAENLGDGTLGLALDEEIFIAERVFHQGTKQLAATLIEEYLHLRHKLKDETRELQTYLFDRIVSLGEELQGEPL